MSRGYIRIIDPSEIKVGMVIEWDRGDDFIVKCEVKSIHIHIKRYFVGADYCVNGQESDLGYIPGGADVKVIREPDITQPEDDDSVADWSEICNLGQVRVVNEDPFDESEQ